MSEFPAVKPSFPGVIGSSVLATMFNGVPASIGPVRTADPTHISDPPSTSNIPISSPATRLLPSNVPAVTTKFIG